MRKYIIGAIFGGLLTLTTSTYASDIKSMIGSVVSGSFPLIIDGVKADKDAIVVNNVSYIPVRSAGQLFGYDISFIDSQVLLKKRNNTVTMKSVVVATMTDDEKTALMADNAIKEQTDKNEKAKQANIKNESIGKLQGQITIKKNFIETTRSAVDDLNKRILLETEKSQLDTLNATLKTNKDDMAKLQLEVDDLQKQIDAINATITPTP